MGIKLLRRLGLGLSHLHDHKFKHGFQNLLNPICNCGTDTETTANDLLHCRNFTDERLILINNILNIRKNILELNEFLIFRSAFIYFYLHPCTVVLLFSFLLFSLVFFFH